MAKSCPICGKGTYMYYPLCKEHLDMSKKGEVIKCPKCGTWHLAKYECPACKKSGNKPETKAEVVGEEKQTNDELPSKEQQETKRQTKPTLNGKGKNDEDDEEAKEFKKKAHSIGGSGDNDTVYCLICGKPTFKGHHFCYDCYKKYSDKDLFLQISDCRESVVLAADYKSPKKCSDGHKVKSKTEREIDNFLFNNHIEHIYESTVTLNVNGEMKDFHPDFCLPNRFPNQPFGSKRNLYIEHLGLWNAGTAEYNRQAISKAKLYKENGITVIFTYENEMDDIDGTLNRDLSIIQCGQILNSPEKK